MKQSLASLKKHTLIHQKVFEWNPSEYVRNVNPSETLSYIRKDKRVKFDTLTYKQTLKLIKFCEIFANNIGKYRKILKGLSFKETVEQQEIDKLMQYFSTVEQYYYDIFKQKDAVEIEGLNEPLLIHDVPHTVDELHQLAKKVNSVN